MQERPRNFKRRVYLDFDGTLTGRSGSRTVGQSIYKSLKKNEEQDYVWAEFKEDLPTILKTHISKMQELDMLVSPAAIAYLKAISADPDTEVVIISKNRLQYIRAVLEVSGLELTLINKIIIYDIKDMKSVGEKDDVIRMHEQRGSAEKVTFCDDDAGDAMRMEAALARYKDAVKGFHRQPNDFKWDEILKETLSNPEPERKFKP